MNNASVAGQANAGLRKVLRALEDLADEAPNITSGRVAVVAGMTPRWARRCLHRLAGLGLVEYRPGYVRLTEAGHR